MTVTQCCCYTPELRVFNAEETEIRQLPNTFFYLGNENPAPGFKATTDNIESPYCFVPKLMVSR